MQACCTLYRSEEADLVPVPGSACRRKYVRDQYMSNSQHSIMIMIRGWG